MVNKPKFVPRKITVTLTVGGVTITDVVGVAATFELNGIPSCTCDLAAGVNLKTGAASSANSGALDSVPLRAPATVTATVFAPDGGDEDAGLAPGTYVIFDGYYIGTGWSRTREEAHFQVHLIHWIDDLNCSSMVNGNYSPGMPGDMAQAAVRVALQTIENDDAGTVAVPFIGKPNINADIWEGNIKPILEAIADMPHFKEQYVGQRGGTAASGNTAAREALKKMPCSAANNVGTKLNLAGDIFISSLESSFQYSLTEMITNNMGYTSFWNKLFGELCPEFLLSISPAVTCANVIPFFGGLSTSHVTITANEYNVAKFNCTATNLIESFTLFHSMQATTGTEKPGENPAAVKPPDYFLPFGEYPKQSAGDAVDFRGVILVKKPPRWLANGSPMGGVVDRTALNLPHDAHTGSKNNSTTPPNGKIDSRSAQASFRPLADRYCEHWYKTSVLSQRQGELSGKLRFDIAPGSIVEIELPEESKAAGGPPSYFAAVMSVSYIINSDYPMAGTSFKLGWMRTKAENEKPTLTSAVAPLYTSAWPGGPLAIQ